MAYPKGKPRPPGAGRKKGTPNKATAAVAQAVAESGQTPLDFMLGVMRDEGKDFGVRLDAAKSAAPYVHPKLAAIEHTGRDGGPVQFENVTDEQLIADIRRLESELAGVLGKAAGPAPSANGAAPALPPARR